MKDRNFNGLSGRFARNIYDDPKGQIRLQLVQEDLLVSCPQLTDGKPLRILDAGCGMGQITALLVKLGHSVVCCDISDAMLAQTRAHLLEGGEIDEEQLGKVRFIHAPVQQLHSHIDETFDLVIFHAVLEWLAQPQDGLRALLPCLKPEGTLSIMFYNVHSLIFKNLLRGNFAKIRNSAFRGDPGGLTPLNPLEPADVEQWLNSEGLKIYSKRGIRTFYDYMNHSMNHKKLTLDLADVIDMERKFGVLEPYRSLARYMLWHCRKAG